jgi:hypothetical protein
MFTAGYPCAMHALTTLQELEVRVCGLCWWGEEAVLAVTKQGSLYWLKVYPRTHLDTASLLHPPVRLPVGMKPAFFSAVPATTAGTAAAAAGGSAASSSKEQGEALHVLVASQRSYLVYTVRCVMCLCATYIACCLTHSADSATVLVTAIINRKTASEL